MGPGGEPNAAALQRLPSPLSASRFRTWSGIDRKAYLGGNHASRVESGVMAATSAIEWTNATWNPVTGCDKVSPGCAHCYAETFAERFRNVLGHPYEQGFDLRFWPERLELPLTWRKPRMIFVNSMSDLFHERVPLDYIARVFDTMERASRHTFQILTKRHERLSDLAHLVPWP